MMFDVYEELDDYGQPRRGVAGRGMTARAVPGRVGVQRAGGIQRAEGIQRASSQAMRFTRPSVMSAETRSREMAITRARAAGVAGVPPHRHEAYEARMNKADAAIRALVQENGKLIGALRGALQEVGNTRAIAAKALAVAGDAAKSAAASARQAKALVGAVPAPVTFTPREPPPEVPAPEFMPETEGVEVSLTPPMPETVETDMEAAQAEASTPEAEAGDTSSGLSYYYDYEDADRDDD